MSYTKKTLQRMDGSVNLTGYKRIQGKNEHQGGAKNDRPILLLEI